MEPTTTHMNTTTITPEIFARVEAAYSKYPLTNKVKTEAGGFFDLSRRPVEIIQICDGVLGVIDEPANYKDYFGFARACVSGKYGVAKAMQKFYSCKLLRLESMTLETCNWQGGSFCKDAEKAQKQLAKFKASTAKNISNMPLMENIGI